MTKLSYKERSRRRREQEILRTAARMIRDNGYINLNMDDLAEEVGISKPTLYQHFKGKEDMVAQTMLHTMREMEDYMETLDGDSALERLMRVMRYMLETHANPQGLSVAIVQDTATALQHLTHGNDEMQEIQGRLGQQIYDLIQAAKAEGSIREDLPNLVIVGAMFSYTTILRGPEIMRDYSVDADAIIDHILTLFRQGVAA